MVGLAACSPAGGPTEVDVPGVAAEVALLVPDDPDAAEDFHTEGGIVGLPIAVDAPGAASARLSIPVLVNE